MGGSSGGSGRARSGAADIISRGGGILAGEYPRTGMRDMTMVTRAFAGTSRSGAQAIATGKRAVSGGASKLPPIRVEIYQPRSGRAQITLVDGRHRSQAARAAGATHIRAVVRRHHETKSGDIRETTSGWGTTRPTIIKL